MIKLVVFDFDGTLTPNKFDGNYLISKYLKKERIFRKIVTAYHSKQITGEEAVESLAHAFKGLTKNDIKYIQTQFKLRPGVYETFNELRKRKIKTAIVTGEGNEMMKEILKFLKPDFFDGADWVFEGSIMNGKIDWDFEYKKELPHHLQNMFDLKAEEMMAVGDTWADFGMVPKGGVKVAIGKYIKRGYNYHINEIPEILDIIDKIK